MQSLLNTEEHSEYLSRWGEPIENLTDTTDHTLHACRVMEAGRVHKKIIDASEFEALKHNIAKLKQQIMQLIKGGDPIPAASDPIAFNRRYKLENSVKNIENRIELLEQNHKNIENRLELLEQNQTQLTTTPHSVVVNKAPTEEILISNLVNSLNVPQNVQRNKPNYTPDEVGKMTDAELINQFGRITGHTQLAAKNKSPTDLIFWVEAIRARCVAQPTKGGGNGLYAEMPLPKTPDANLRQNIKTNDENNRAFGLLRKAHIQNDQQTINAVQQKRSEELAKIGVVTHPYKYKIVVG